VCPESLGKYGFKRRVQSLRPPDELHDIDTPLAGLDLRNERLMNAEAFC